MTDFKDKRETLIVGATLVPMTGDPLGKNPVGACHVADLRIEDGVITETGPALEPRSPEATRYEASGAYALPGFVQGHVHFCQTLFRGLADDLPLMRWLRERIWPLEAAHDEDSTRASAELSITELLRGGTTTVQAIESVRHTEQAFEAAADAGITAILGNCLMDRGGEGIPDGWVSEGSAAAIRTSDQLRARFHGQGRLHYAISPRFILSCSDELSREAAAYAAQYELRLHTHAAEHPAECQEVEQTFQCSYIEALDQFGQLGPRTTLAHCVHTDDRERTLLADTGTGVLHCPSTNLKLGSGIAPLTDYERRGIGLALGADGAPCNNRLSALAEVRQAALLQALAAGPGAWPAVRALVAATSGGARILGLDDVGSLAVGARGDVVLFRFGRRSPSTAAELDDQPHSTKPQLDSVVSRIVFSAREDDIEAVFVGGQLRVRDAQVIGLDEDELRRRVATARKRVADRAL